MKKGETVARTLIILTDRYKHWPVSSKSKL